MDICELLKGNPYPGRGIVLGLGEDGSRSVVVYFIMGRSGNSRNRVFARTGDGIRTAAFDPAKLADPSLIIYHPVRVLGGRTIVTNGDQTDTIRDFIANGQDFRSALLTREYEPDAPNFTPRISGIVERDGSYSLSILKAAAYPADRKSGGSGLFWAADGQDADVRSATPKCCLRSFFEYSKAIPGLGHFVSTYKTDGDPLPSFDGEPIPVDIAVAGGLESYANAIWEALNDENKVSLYVRETVISSGESTDIIINKHGAGT